MYEKLTKSAQFIQTKDQRVPQIGIVLGSGLGAFVEHLENKVEVPYNEIPYFHNTTVEGHKGRLILGEIAGVCIAVLQGRLHAYEGLPMDEVVFPIRVLATLGIENLVLTNASGGVNPELSTGDLVLIDDHINFMGRNPLVGPNINELGPRFPDMTQTYTPKFKEIAQEVAGKLGFELKKGVYAAVLGPTYETPAEVRMLRTLGADVVGMSTVPEAIAASHLGLGVLGISCVANMAAGYEQKKLCHDDIKESAKLIMGNFTDLLGQMVEKIAALESAN